MRHEGTGSHDMKPSSSSFSLSGIPRADVLGVDGSEPSSASYQGSSPLLPLTSPVTTQRDKKYVDFPKVKPWHSTSFVRASDERKRFYYHSIVSYSPSLLQVHKQTKSDRRASPSTSPIHHSRGGVSTNRSGLSPISDLSDEYEKEEEEEDYFLCPPSDDEREEEAKEKGLSDLLLGMNDSSKKKRPVQSVYSHTAVKESEIAANYKLETLKLLKDVNSHLGLARSVLNGKRPHDKKDKSSQRSKVNLSPLPTPSNPQVALEQQDTEPVVSLPPEQRDDDVTILQHAYNDMVDLYGEDQVYNAIGPLKREVLKVKALHHQKNTSGAREAKRKRKLPPINYLRKLNGQEAWIYAQKENLPGNTWTRSFDPSLKKQYYYDHRTGVFAEVFHGNRGKELKQIGQLLKTDSNAHLFVNDRQTATAHMHAVEKIQQLFRTATARRRFRKKKEEVSVVRIYDPRQRRFYFYNQFTKEVLHNSPPGWRQQRIRDPKLSATVKVQREFRGYKGRKCVREHAKKRVNELETKALKFLVISIPGVYGIYTHPPRGVDNATDNSKAIVFLTLKYMGKFRETVSVVCEVGGLAPKLEFLYPMLWEAPWDGVPIHLATAARYGVVRRKGRSHASRVQLASPSDRSVGQTSSASEQLEIMVWQDIKGDPEPLGRVTLDIVDIKISSTPHDSKMMTSSDITIKIGDPPEQVLKSIEPRHQQSSAEAKLSLIWCCSKKKDQIFDTLSDLDCKVPSHCCVDYYIGEDKKLHLKSYRSRLTQYLPWVQFENIKVINPPITELLNAGTELFLKLTYGHQHAASSSVTNSLAEIGWPHDSPHLFIFDENVTTATLSLYSKNADKVDKEISRAIVPLVSILRQFEAKTVNTTKVLKGETLTGRNTQTIPLKSLKLGSNPAVGPSKSKSKSGVSFDFSWSGVGVAFLQRAEDYRGGGRNDVVKGPRFELKLISASNLPSFDVGGWSDPFVEVNYGSAKSFSSAVFKSLNPEWKDDPPHAFSYNSSVSSIDMKIYDMDSNSDDLMGLVSIQLPTLLKAELPVGDGKVLNGKKLVKRSIVADPSMDPQQQARVQGELIFEVSWFEISIEGLISDPTNTAAKLTNVPGPSSRMLFPARTSITKEKANSEIVKLAEKQQILSEKRAAIQGGRLEIELISGTNLAAFDFLGASDPFVVISYGSEKSVSSVAYKTLNPVWKDDSPHVFTFKKEATSLELLLFDKDAKEDEIMGRILVPIIPALNSAVAVSDKEHDYQLTLTLPLTAHPSMSPKSLSKVKGELSFRIVWVDIKDAKSIRQDVITGKLNKLIRNKIIVNVISASNLAKFDAGIFAKSDPFVQVNYGISQTKRTDVKYKELNPRWNAVIEFDYDPKVKIIECMLLDKDGAADELMGVVKIDISTCPEEPVDYPVQPHTRMTEDNKKKVQGILKLQIEFH